MRKMKERGSHASPLGSLRVMVLKAFGGNIGLDSSRADNEIPVEGNNHYYLPGEARSALLDAEYLKATAEMELQRQRYKRFC